MATTNCSEFQLGEIAGEAGQCSIVGDGESTLIVPIAASSVHNIQKQWTTSFVLGGCVHSHRERGTVPCSGDMDQFRPDSGKFFLKKCFTFRDPIVRELCDCECVFSRQVWSAVPRKLHLVVSVREEKNLQLVAAGEERKAVPAQGVPIVAKMFME
jgi:hypothetical protein